MASHPCHRMLRGAITLVVVLVMMLLEVVAGVAAPQDDSRRPGNQASIDVFALSQHSVAFGTKAFAQIVSYYSKADEIANAGPTPLGDAARSSQLSVVGEIVSLETQAKEFAATHGGTLTVTDLSQLATLPPAAAATTMTSSAPSSSVGPTTGVGYDASSSASSSHGGAAAATGMLASGVAAAAAAGVLVAAMVL